MIQSILLLFLCALSSANSFVANSDSARAIRMKPLHENFFLDIAADPAAATPKQLYGEVAYKSFVEKTVPDGLLVAKYDLITRVRQLKLLSTLADSGLLEALESKGLTLSKVEKLLPLADELNLLPLVLKNKDLLLFAAPLLVEPAPALLPLAVSLLKTPATSFLAPGASLLLAGLVELNDNLLLALLTLLLGLPLTVVGAVLNAIKFDSIPTIRSSAVKSVEPIQKTSSRPMAAKRVASPVATAAAAAKAPVLAAPLIKVTSAPVVTAVGGSYGTRRRAVVKVRR
jgi:hypothetical protein